MRTVAGSSKARLGLKKVKSMNVQGYYVEALEARFSAIHIYERNVRLTGIKINVASRRVWEAGLMRTQGEFLRLS